MQTLIEWIRNRLFPNRNKPEPVLRQTGVRVRPIAERQDASNRVQPDTGKNTVHEPGPKFEAEIGGRIDDAGPGKNVLLRSKYLREDSGTHDTLKIIDVNELGDEGEDSGIDPYNTGRFDRSKSWNNRSRK